MLTYLPVCFFRSLFFSSFLFFSLFNYKFKKAKTVKSQTTVVFDCFLNKTDNVNKKQLTLRLKKLSRAQYRLLANHILANAWICSHKRTLIR